MQQRQVHKPISVNLDKSKKYLLPEEAYYLLNRERNINGVGTAGKTTPLVANYLACLITQPAGSNYLSGHHYSVLTDELYWWTWNSNGVNYIARINSDGTCTIVYDGACLPLSINPSNTIEQFRAYLKYDRFCANQHGKQLIWVNGEDEIGQIDVEASIETNSFTTSFFNNCPDYCAPVQMCVPEICGSLQGTFIPLITDQKDLNNHIINVGLKVRCRHIYYDQRASEWSDFNTLFFEDTTGCFDTSVGFPRCIKFILPLGNPLVDKIEFAVSTDNGATWSSYDIIEKYQPYISSTQYWYERSLAALPDLDLVNCTFSYTFCNDKECNPLDPLETSRVFNPMPRKPQGLIRIKNTLGFYNYLAGNCPIDGSEAKKFEISLDCSGGLSSCVEQMATVTVYSLIYNGDLALNGFVYREGGNSINAADDITDIARFGINYTGGNVPYIPVGYGQAFTDLNVRNFIAYVEGTNYWAQMQQYYAKAGFVNPVLNGIISGMSDPVQQLYVISNIINGGFYVQEYKLKVPKGTRGIIRIASHEVSDGLPGYGQNKSTFVIGTIPDITTYSGTANINGSINRDKKELYFDTCSGDVTLSETLIIESLCTPFKTGYHSSCGYSGYITDANNVPIEGALIYYLGVVEAITDFNGHYDFHTYQFSNNQIINVGIAVETNCGAGFNIVKTVTLSGSYNSTVKTDIQITDTDFPNYKSGYYQIVKIPVTDCSSSPIGGIRVALSGSKYQVTDGITGIATFHVRNYATRTRSVRAIVMDTENCFSLDCSNNCNPCIPETNDTALPACFAYVSPNTSTINLTSLLNKVSAFNNKMGLKAGGRYPFGFVVAGDCGRMSAVYPATIISGSLPLLDNFLNIPKTQEKNTLDFCQLNYRTNGMVLPSWANCLKIVRGVNVNNYELQWVVDQIDRTGDRKIKLTIQSLNDYNTKYNFQTNTTYQYQKNDRVEFISNGDGTIFNISTYGLLNYQILSPFNDINIGGVTNPPANYFNQIVIDDDGKLDSLVVGAKIELQRPRDCTVEPTYYEILSLPVVNGFVVTPFGNFNTYDTYFVNRQIVNQIGVSNPPQIFEHKFPSDFWGTNAITGLSDVGKVHFTNKYENEKRYGRNITLNTETQFNRFGDLEKTFDASEQGDITAIGLYDGQIGLSIAEFDNFLFQISDEFLRVGAGGVIQAAPVNSLISNPQPKVSGIYGCRYDSIGSVYFGDGFVTWVDTAKAALVKHNFGTAIDISEGKFSTWMKRKCQLIENYNKTAIDDAHKYRWITGFNFHTNALQLTVKSLTDSGINNQIEPFILNNETILIEPRTAELLTFASYTAEAYSNVPLNNSTGCAFVSFLNGVPYIHPILAINYNQFFGVAVDSVVGFAINMKDKIIRPLSLQIQDETMWFAAKVTVDNPTFQSIIPPKRCNNKTENKWDANFLCDINSRGGLYGSDKRVAGTKPSGYFCAVTLVRDNTNNLIYNSTNDLKRTAFDELDLIISKFLFSEESGYTSNL